MFRPAVWIAISAVAVCATGPAAWAAPGGRSQGGHSNDVLVHGEWRWAPRSTLTKKERRFRAEFRELRADVVDAMARNGGSLPEAERQVLQQRLDDLRMRMRASR